jgi:hypothetical protein
MGSGNTGRVLGTVPSGSQPDSSVTREAHASQEKDKLTGAETGGRGFMARVRWVLWQAPSPGVTFPCLLSVLL